MTEHYYAIFPSGKYQDNDISGVLRRTLKAEGQWCDEVYAADGRWEWSPIWLHHDYVSDHAFRFSVITEGEAENIIRRLDKPR